ncbi:restriction endonuclease [Ralstonia holmesii]|uniref:restriction endonuclease n=1 Tax=Ralstonia TaxID=48736 RepID=UPI000468CC49|nr:restriction endonuclease [Ralstonia pickettii]
MLGYQVEAWHEGLAKHRVIKGETSQIVETKARLLAEEWDKRWAALSQRAVDKRILDKSKEVAAALTEDAVAELELLRTLLSARVAEGIRIDWESMKDRAPFPESEPAMPAQPHPPKRGFVVDKPERGDPRYQPSLGLLDKLIPSRRQKRLSEAEAQYQADLFYWNKEDARIQAGYTAALETYNSSVRQAEHAHKVLHSAWESERTAWQERQTEQHRSVDILHKAYLAREPQAVVNYCSYVLSDSPYPDYVNLSSEMDYDAASRTLLVEAQLPAPSDLPTLKSVKFVAVRNELDETHISEAERLRLYDSVLYQITLRSLYEIFVSDEIDAIDSIVLNGIVNSISPKTGLDVSACVLSVRANKSEFMNINLAQVDPKECFKSLKGVGSARLSGLTAVPPVMQWSREDKRFIASYAVVGTLDDSVNLAAMDWEDFEHLIRELFEKEFTSSGGEVRVTQASRDGGVDAVAFDPDPIRGGKIVIQAKRWTNTVGVAAVRDLYGTVMAEGATKGVLVTTSDYGSESYDFAQGKPLTLLNGGNLLSLLEKHGHRARIDIQEAKKLITPTGYR